MNIIVLIKEVPDMNKVKFDSEKGVVDRASADSEINPFDMNALQAAIDIKKQCEANVIALTMGPNKAEKSLRDAYARGADDCVILTDKKFGGSDTYATAKTLAAGIKKFGNYDLIICGEKSVDGDTAQVGAEVAEFLNIPHSYYVEKINKVNESSIEVTIESISGGKQIRELKLPALISVSKNINKPLLPTLSRKLNSLSADIKTYTYESLKDYISENETGFKGSPTKVSKVVVPKEIIKENKIFRDDTNKFINIIGQEFKSIGILQGGKDE